MALLNITKVAVGCPSLDILAERLQARTTNEVAVVTTRNRPTRHAELIGGSLFWIIKHKLVARQQILGFEEMENERRWIILLDARLIPVDPRPRRAHQGWRYLEGSDAPVDLAALGGAELPAALRHELAALGLL
ncbi:DUF1489 domain-containing protein [Sphingomonas sp. C3-2]|uniref:DUF1489 family protein n=1 Tax=Sphingomonas sp. C3-2 TaxID=3062169 RepID=UPI00294AFE13|nr:DUF1489 domain-containing protein [Sphingomonas sp. C3-2]WOK38192.1 DUF1489 domain-containing protein [Sphingomonas sp. C3-2]